MICNANSITPLEEVTLVITECEIGPAGLSAYQLALAEGFVGTLAEWLSSLQGSGSGSNNWDLLINKPPLTFTYNALNQSTIGITHNMQKNPGVFATDTGNNVWHPNSIVFNSLNTLTITFTFPFSGLIQLS